MKLALSETLKTGLVVMKPNYYGPARLILVLIIYAQKPPLSAHADVYSGIRDWAVDVRRCDKYQTLMFWLIQRSCTCSLTLKAPITTAADDKFCDIFPSFRQK